MIRLKVTIMACLITLTLGSCQPGDYCGRESFLDCDLNCIHMKEYLDIRGDGLCDDNLNCSTFDFDGGDYEGGS